METHQANSVHTVSIDETGELAIIDVGGSDAHSQAVGLNIDGVGGAEAAYAIDLGERDADGNPVWFDETEYDATDRVRDAWRQAQRYLRIRVTSAAPADSDARLYVSRGA